MYILYMCNIYVHTHVVVNEYVNIIYTPVVNDECIIYIYLLL